LELMYEVRTEAMSKVTKVENEPEMSEFESAFLCGLIKEKRPKKILEIGVAAGGTTAIIMQCLNDLGIEDCEFISVDLNEKFYRGDGRDTGFLGREMKEKIPNINHRFVLGHVAAETIEQIGGGIDLAILDTVHCLPGEVLDFPVVLPFLSKEAVVVLHDVTYHQYCSKEGMATQVLLDVITGEKIIPLGLDKTQPMPNIAAVRVNNDTSKYIDSVFHAMVLPWCYIPAKSEILAYREFYRKYYDNDLVEMYDVAVQLNQILLKRNQIVNMREVLRRIKLAGRMIIKGF